MHRKFKYISIGQNVSPCLLSEWKMWQCGIELNFPVTGSQNGSLFFTEYWLKYHYNHYVASPQQLPAAWSPAAVREREPALFLLPTPSPWTHSRGRAQAGHEKAAKIEPIVAQVSNYHCQLSHFKVFNLTQ